MCTKNKLCDALALVRDLGVVRSVPRRQVERLLAGAERAPADDLHDIGVLWRCLPLLGIARTEEQWSGIAHEIDDLLAASVPDVGDDDLGPGPLPLPVGVLRDVTNHARPASRVPSSQEKGSGGLAIQFTQTSELRRSHSHAASASVSLSPPPTFGLSTHFTRANGHASTHVNGHSNARVNTG